MFFFTLSKPKNTSPRNKTLPGVCVLILSELLMRACVRFRSKSTPLQAGIQEGEQKTQKTIKEIESNGLTVDAEPADKKEEEKA